MPTPINTDLLRNVLVDTYITNVPKLFLNVKDHGTENADSPMLSGLGRKDRIEAETLLTDLGIKGYWSRAEKGIILEIPIKQRGQPRTDAAEYIAHSLNTAGFPATVIRTTL